MVIFARSHLPEGSVPPANFVYGRFRLCPPVCLDVPPRPLAGLTLGEKNPSGDPLGEKFLGGKTQSLDLFPSVRTAGSL
jgi:hypothetical protein